MKRLSDYPDYAAEVEKLEQLKSAHNAAQATVSRLVSELNQAANRGRSVDKITAAAEMLLDGGHVESASSVEGMREELKTAKHLVAVHDAAVRLQQRRVETLRAQYSIEICTAAEGDYAKRVKKAVAAAAELAKAWQGVLDLRNELADDGVLVMLPETPPHLGAVGRWKDPHAPVHNLITQATKTGYVNGEYKNRPQPAGPYDNLPDGGIERLAAGPEGISRVQVCRGGKVKLLERLCKPAPKAREDGWSAPSGNLSREELKDAKLAAGPEGTRLVREGKDGQLETLRWLSRGESTEETKHA